jgi:hypothetical protein
MLALRTAALVALVAVFIVTYLAFRACPEPGSLPGVRIYEAGRRLGWGCRPDPQREFGESFYFFTGPPPLPSRLAGTQVLDDQNAAGLIRVFHLATGFGAEDAAMARRTARIVAGWELRGDPTMVEAMARELGP